MSLLILQAIEEKRSSIPSSLKTALSGGVVSRAQRHYHEITGQKKNPKFFYRESSPEDERTTMMQRQAAVYFSIGFANKTSGDLLDEEFRSWSAVRAMLQSSQVVPAGGMWRSQEETDALLNNLRSAFLSGNRIEARFVLVQIRRNVDTMLRLIEVEMPGFAGLEIRR